MADDESDVLSVIAEHEQWIKNVLDTLGWSRDHVFQQPDLVSCPINSAHKMPASSLENHLRLCPSIQKGYTKRELEEDCSSKFFYEKSSTVVSLDLDDETLLRVISSAYSPSNPVTIDDLPLTMYRSLATLNSAQRLAIYEHCIEQAKQCHQQTSIPLEQLQFLQEEDDRKDQKSFLELKAQERDQKRRRQSYKGKNVSTKNKSHLQVIQEVINNQTELLAQKWKQEQMEKDREERRKERKKEREHSKSRERGKKEEATSKSDRSHHKREKSEDRHSKHKHKKHKKHKHKGKSKHRSRSQSRSRSRGRSRTRGRSTSKGRSTSREVSRRRSRS